MPFVPQKYHNIFMVILSGIMVSISIYHVWFWLIWIALVPLLSVLLSQPPKKAFFYGWLFGITEASVLLFWITASTQRYSGSQTLLGVPIWMAAVLYYAFFPALFAVVFTWFFGKKEHIKSSLVLQIILAGAIWILCEWLRMNLLPGMPWLKYSLGFTQASNLNGIQLAAVTGQWGISAVIMAVNYLFVYAIVKKQCSVAVIGAGLVLLFYGFGFIASNPSNEKSKPVKIAILQENMKAETKWQASTGDSLAAIYFNLNRQAVKKHPDIILWSETALPWTFRTDDDLLHMILQITYESKAGHILGSLSEAEGDPGKVYNSAYYIEPDGRVTSRYDKVDLLSFIEKPLLSPSLRVPFLSQGVHNNVLAGSDIRLLNTSFGKIGVLICNESLLPYQSHKAVKMGADFLVNMSNDAWFEGTHLVKHHFYYARMRAVETGKNVVVNSNRGIAGLIEGNGKIIKRHVSTLPSCIDVDLTPGTRTTLYQTLGDWMIWAGIFILISAFLFNRKMKHGN